MSNYIEVGKLEGAKRHLEVAIRMFFEQKDPIAVYTVGWAAYQTLSDICRNKGIEREVEDNPILTELGIKKEFMVAFRSPRNFFHHADRDHEEVIKFFPDTAYLIALLATELLKKLTNQEFWYGRVLQFWFFIKHPEAAPKIFSSRINTIPYQPKLEDYDIFIELLSKNDN